MRNHSTKLRLPTFDENGILLIDKPLDWTSFDVVNCVRARFNIPKVGHCGTLDPAASGLLVLVFNKFTQLSGTLSGEDKTYSATLLLGTETDSQDRAGTVIATHDFSNVTEPLLRETLSGFLGAQQQTPPMVSAVKKDGKRLYELARKGIEVERESKDIHIFSIDITRVELPYCDFTVKCSKGTYIRTLCSDIGKKLGCGAMLHALRRIQSGQFDVADAVSMDTVKSWEQPDLDAHLKHFLAAKLTANLSKMQ